MQRPTRPGRLAALAAALAVLAPAAACTPANPTPSFGPPVAAPPTGAPTIGGMLCADDSRFPLTGTGTDPGAATRAWHLSHLKALGVVHVRHDLRWDQVEPARGQFHWDRLDPGIDDIAASGLELIGILDYGVPWASSQTTRDPMYPPDDPMDFAAYARAVAARYQGKISIYEIWNEENSGFRFWKPRPDPAAYADLLHDAYGAIHRAYPGATVIYGSLFYVPQVVEGAVPYLEASFAARPDLARDFDAFGFHPYQPYPPSLPPEADTGQAVPVDQMVANLKAVLEAHGAGDKPMLATECGWPTYGTVTERRQAAWLAREILWLNAERVPLSCVFTLIDGPNAGSFPPEDDFGLFHWDKAKGAPGTKKLAWSAIHTLATRLGGLAVSERLGKHLGLGPNRYAFRLAGPAGRHWVDALWAYDDGFGGEVTVREPAGTTLKVIDALGRPASHTVHGTAVTVTVSAMPVYVVASLPTPGN